MPNTPKPPDRPDVEGIAARAEADWRKRGMTPPVQEALALIAHIEALEARMEKLEAVVEIAGKLRKPLYNLFGFGFDIYLHDDKTWSGDCTPEQARAEYEKCDVAQAKLKLALAALGDGDG